MEDIQVLRTFDITCSRLLKVTVASPATGETLSHIDGTMIVSPKGGLADAMTDTFIGYARCSTDMQDLAAQRAALEAFGVVQERIYVDHGLSGTTRDRPGLTKPSRRFVPPIPWLCRSSTALHVQSPTPGPSPTSSPSGELASCQSAQVHGPSCRSAGARLGGKQGCEVCGSETVDAHHDRYDEPLNVRWLCRRHHVRLHQGGEDMFPIGCALPEAPSRDD